MLKVGEPVPDFALPNQDGQTVKLSDFRGQKAVIFSFPKANSMGCTVQACAFRDALPKFDGVKAVVLGISGDQTKDLQSWKTAQKLQYDLLSDPDHVVLDHWSAWGTSLFGILPMNMAKRSYWVIDEQGVLIDMQVNVGPKESVEKALSALNQATSARA